MDESEEGGSQLVVACGNAPELLQLVEEALDVVALTINLLLPAVAPLAVGFVGNIGDRALAPDVGPHPVGVVALVGDDDRAALETVEQRLGTGDVVILAGRDQEPDGPAFGVDARVDLRREPASASAHTTISTLFLTPEACW